MTAIQQYLLVENEVYLVSSLYPVIQGGDGVVGGFSVPSGTASIRLTPYGVDDVVGQPSIVAASTTSVVRTQDQPFDSADRLVGAAAVQSVAVVNIVRNLDQVFDSANAVNGGYSIQAGSVTVVVKQYSVLEADALENRLNGAAAIMTAVKT